MHSIFPTRFSYLLLSCLLFIQCRHEYSYEGGAVNRGTAVYTLNDAKGICLGVVANGKYYVGYSLDSSNTLLLSVNVTTIGTYQLTTTSVDGFNFSGSGKFTSTGNQTILLSGNGAPVTDGLFNFTVANGSSCSFTIKVEPASAAIADISLEGAPTVCTNPVVLGNYIAGKAMNFTNTIDLSVIVNALGNYSISTDTLDGIYFSAKGIATTKGKQVITLNGNGTPVVPRYLNFTPKAINSSCTIPITIQNPDPVATYVLESGFGNPNPCVYTVAGNFAVDTILNNSHIVRIRAFVTALGNYTVASDTLNGMSFSYTGMFTSTGINFINLYGNGKPIAKGTFSFNPQIVGPHPLGGQTCAFAVTVN